MYNDLLFLLRLVAGELVGTVKYSTDLFDVARISALCRQPDRRLDTLLAAVEAPWPQAVKAP